MTACLSACLFDPLSVYAVVQISISVGLCFWLDGCLSAVWPACDWLHACLHDTSGLQ